MYVYLICLYIWTRAWADDDDKAPYIKVRLCMYVCMCLVSLTASVYVQLVVLIPTPRHARQNSKPSATRSGPRRKLYVYVLRIYVMGWVGPAGQTCALTSQHTNTNTPGSVREEGRGHGHQGACKRIQIFVPSVIAH